jgi:hypothetical protein
VWNSNILIIIIVSWNELEFRQHNIDYHVDFSCRDLQKMMDDDPSFNLLSQLLEVCQVYMFCHCEASCIESRIADY